METMGSSEGSEISVESACALLNTQNPYSEDVAAVLYNYRRLRQLTLRKKSSDLVEVVQELKNRRKYPVVDKNLKLVLGIDYGHGTLRTRLFRYHNHEKNPDDLTTPPISDDGAADRYITDGYGYQISSAYPSHIVIGTNYRPDNFDKDLFMIYKLDRV